LVEDQGRTTIRTTMTAMINEKTPLNIARRDSPPAACADDA
jgi:hypothetical protein